MQLLSALLLFFYLFFYLCFTNLHLFKEMLDAALSALHFFLLFYSLKLFFTLQIVYRHFSF